jgi:hypothetical protein
MAHQALPAESTKQYILVFCMKNMPAHHPTLHQSIAALTLKPLPQFQRTKYGAESNFKSLEGAL